MASLVLARMPPAHLLALGVRSLAVSKSTATPLRKQDVMEETIRQWQDLWASSAKAKWMRRLIPDLSKWWYHGPRQVSFHLSQALTGHGCFQRYLWTKGRASSPACVHCPNLSDDAEHTIFRCPFWDGARCGISASLGRPVQPEDVMELLCDPAWSELPSDPEHRRRIIATASRRKELFIEMVEEILTRKEDLERARQRLAAAVLSD